MNKLQEEKKLKRVILNKIFFTGFAFSLMTAALLFNIEKPIAAIVAFAAVLVNSVGLAKTNNVR